MERYLVFAFSTFYPEGGMEDCKLRTDDRGEALTYAADKVEDGYHAHILDTHTGALTFALDES